MNLFAVPWLELSVCIPLAGSVCIARLRNLVAAQRWCFAFAAVTLACTLLVFVGQASGFSPTGASEWDTQLQLFGVRFLEVDALSAPLLPLVALLHLLTVLTTARTKFPHDSFAWMLCLEAVRLATFGCKIPWVLTGLLIAGAGLTWFELVRRGKSTRVYALHMGLFAVCLVGGWACVDPALPVQSPTLASLLMFAAVLIRSGTVPVHVWVTELFENASFGTALLFAAPLTAMYVAVRLVLPIAPDWVLAGISVISLVTACYAAGMAAVQKDERRFFAFLFLSHASLVLVGMELHTSLSLTAALFLWLSAALSLGGLGLTIRALEARFGRLSLSRFSGLYDHSPALAVCFLVTGLGCVGFPGTLGFVGMELLVEGAMGASPAVAIAIVLTAAINGIAIMRVYFLLFSGGRHVSTLSLAITTPERCAALTLAILILGGGLSSQATIASRFRAAEAALKDSAAHRSAGQANEGIAPTESEWSGGWRPGQLDVSASTAGMP
jgi:NADH-quinone oxidoreductase subunit M